MKELRYTLLSDGSSDKALLPILTWLLRERLVNCAIQPEWADLRKLPKPPKKLPERIKTSLELYPCHLLFVHRDAEKESRQKRVDEIREAIEEAGQSVSVPAVCVVPVRMLETWLLFEESAIRRAVGKPRGRHALQLPARAKLEKEPDPKTLLYELLRQASERTGRDLKKLRVEELVHEVAASIDDFSPLRDLPAFRDMEAEIEQAIEERGWSGE